MNTPQEIREIYKTGSRHDPHPRDVAGRARPRAAARRSTSRACPTRVNKSTLVERIADVALSRKLPHLRRRQGSVDRRCADCAGAEGRRRQADGDGVPLQAHAAPVQLPGQPDVPDPDREPARRQARAARAARRSSGTSCTSGSRSSARGSKHELEALKKRIHILEGFETVFDALDEILKIVRKSDGKADAAEKIMARFKLDAEQTDAILELKIYRLARLEILVIQKELAEKRKRAKEIGGAAQARGRSAGRSSATRSRRSRRRTATRGAREIAGEVAGRGVHRRGLHHRGRQRRHRHARRLGEAAEGSEGHRVDARARGRRGAGGRCRAARGRRSCSSRTSASAYTARIADVPASTGYGEPIQSLFKFKDGEKVVGALSLDPRVGRRRSRRRSRRRRRRSTRWP